MDINFVEFLIVAVIDAADEGEIRKILAQAQAMAWAKENIRVKFVIISSFSNISAALILSKVASISTKILSLEIPSSSYNWIILLALVTEASVSKLNLASISVET